LLNAFDFNTGEGEQVGELGDGQVGEIDVGGEPGERDLHSERRFLGDRIDRILKGLTGFLLGWFMGKIKESACWGRYFAELADFVSLK
jgi:hypothetical protein